MIVWTRGAKKAETKKRLLSDTAQTTVFDEKFEVSTQMEVDSSGKATRSKMSQLIVLSDKSRGVLGKAELDLSKYGTNDFEVHRLALQECAYEDAFVEVRLKGSEKRKQSTRNTPASGSGVSSEEATIASSIMALQEDMDKV